MIDLIAESSELDFLENLAEMRISQPPARLVSEFAERRILPQGTPSPGPWSNSKTPYLVDVMDDFSPWSPVQEEAILKGAQLGFTAAAENIICYWISEAPTAILFVTATEAGLSEWMSKRLEPAIDSFGIRERMISQSETGTIRSGDKMLSKEFSGGSFRGVSAQAAAALRSTSQRLIIKDELDGAPQNLKTGEGNFSDVADARATAFGARKKILNFSTPTTIEDSLIWKKYLEGNQMKFYVKCIHCQQPQELELLGEGAEYGLKGEYDDQKRFVRAVYICKFCHGKIYDHNKTELLSTGEWVETVKTGNPRSISRHISSLYSPEGWLSWTDLYQKYLNALEDPEGMRTFQPLYLGMPFKETGARPSGILMNSLRGDYHEFTVPEGVLYLTAGIDVQAGSERGPDGKLKDPNNPARLEMEVVGHGSGYRTWGITYQIFPGDTSNAFEGAWEKLAEWFSKGKGVFKRGELQFPINLIFIDARNKPEVTYQFCTRGPGMWPSLGMQAKHMVADPKRREIADTAQGFKFYRLTKVTGGQWVYELNVSLYKDGLFGDLGRSGAANRVPGPIQRPSFCDFPMEYDDDYFKGLASEERLADGTYRKTRERNEPLDVRIYAKAAAHVYLDQVVNAAREKARKDGWPVYKINEIGAKYALDYLEQSLKQVRQ